jgi:hypothetical protein
MKKLRQLAGTIVPSYLKKTLQSWHVLAKGYGHLSTCRRWECRDAEGRPLPWYTYPAIDYLRSIDTSSMRVFEYGCGFSTLFWAAKAKSVVSVEDSGEWFEKVRSTMPTNVILKLVQEPERYINAINDADIGRGELFDIVIIDAKHRYETARAAVSHVASGGMLILDNADWYPETATMLSACGLIRIDMIGFGPINSYIWCTSLFLKPDFRPKAIDGRRLIGSVLCKAEDDCPGGRS